MSARRRIVAWVALVVASVVIIAIDITTGLWQDLVILGGIAAGLVTFGLTALVIDRVIARSTQASWVPVTQLALGDILQALMDEEATLNAGAGAVPRTLDQLPLPESDHGWEITAKTVDTLVAVAGAERSALSAVLGTWSSFLAASADVDSVLTAAAEVAERLDRIRAELRSVRNVLLEAPSGGVDPSAVSGRVEAVNGQIRGYNRAAGRLIEALRATIESHGATRGSSIIGR